MGESKKNVAARFAARLKDGWIANDDWSPLTKISMYRIFTDINRNHSLKKAFKKTGLDPSKDGDWKVLCALLAEACFPPAKRRGRPPKWKDGDLLKAYLYGKPMSKIMKQRTYEALSRLRKDDLDLARRIKKLAITAT